MQLVGVCFFGSFGQRFGIYGAILGSPVVPLIFANGYWATGGGTSLLNGALECSCLCRICMVQGSFSYRSLDFL